MAYPNEPFWSALRDGRRIEVDDRVYALSVVSCGDLVMPSGKLIACDPFVTLGADLPWVQVPPGQHPVSVTLADVSETNDGSHIREAYATLSIDPAANETLRKIITPMDKPVPPEMTPDGTYYGFPVDAGTACFVDAEAVAAAMPPPESDWLDELFDNGSPDCWFKRMDDPDHIRRGIANIKLPLARNEENIVIIHSGWGDGRYPVVGGYDEAGRLVRVHIDFLVVFQDTLEAPA